MNGEAPCHPGSIHISPAQCPPSQEGACPCTVSPPHTPPEAACAVTWPHVAHAQVCKHRGERVKRAGSRRPLTDGGAAQGRARGADALWSPPPTLSGCSPRCSPLPSWAGSPVLAPSAWSSSCLVLPRGNASCLRDLGKIPEAPHHTPCVSVPARCHPARGSRCPHAHEISAASSAPTF